MKKRIKELKLSKAERILIESIRKFISVKRNSEKITAYRKWATQSKGEKRISKFLTSEYIEFKTEWFFKGLYNYAKSNLLYFDFYIPKYNLCIEYDGQQHYATTKPESAKMNDYLKNAYCAKNRIHFLRIKYTDFENIEKLICKKIDIIDPVCNA